MRKLVTLKTIDNITPIPDADKLEVAHIGGWNAVVGKGDFYAGQQVFYFETDSMLPLDKKPFEFLRARGVKEQDGREYHRLKAMKLRGIVSDGLVFNKSLINWFVDAEAIDDKIAEINEQGGDFSELFGVIKYEDPILAKLGGSMKRFPDWISKTDEERIQNMPDLLKLIQDTNTWDDWFATEKIDGTSCTIWCRINEEGAYEYGVCSRNYGIKEDPTNTLWGVATTPLINYRYDVYSPLEYLKLKCLEEARKMDGSNTPSFVLQGEVFGEGIQKNPLKIHGQTIRFFNLFKDGGFVSLESVREYFEELMECWVPIYPVSLPHTIEQIIAQPDGLTSLVPRAARNTQIEGLVWRNARMHSILVPSSKQPDWSKIPSEKHQLVKASLEKPIVASFKALSDKYRLKHQ